MSNFLAELELKVHDVVEHVQSAFKYEKTKLAADVRAAVTKAKADAAAAVTAATPEVKAAVDTAVAAVEAAVDAELKKYGV
jgi:hypothetical protein